MNNSVFGIIINKLQDKTPLEPENSGAITFVNHFSYLQWRKNKTPLLHLDKIYSDGIMFCIFMRLFSGKKISRASFDSTSVADMLFSYCAKYGKSIYLVGSTEENNIRAADNITMSYPGINIIGRHNGYFTNKLDTDQTLTEIAKLNPDYVIIGMGAGQQELFQMALKAREDWQGASYTCGGYIHQCAKNVRYFPPLINSLHLRWAYRIWDEPQLLKRYLLLYPLSCFYLIFDYIAFKLFLNSAHAE